jgi:hypothetical protein
MEFKKGNDKWKWTEQNRKKLSLTTNAKLKRHRQYFTNIVPISIFKDFYKTEWHTWGRSSDNPTLILDSKTPIFQLIPENKQIETFH